MKKISILFMVIFILAINTVGAVSIQDLQAKPYVKMSENTNFASYIDSREDITKIIRFEFPYVVVRSDIVIVDKKAKRIVENPETIFFYDLKNDEMIKRVVEINNIYYLNGNLNNNFFKKSEAEFRKDMVGYLMGRYAFFIATGVEYDELCAELKADPDNIVVLNND